MAAEYDDAAREALRSVLLDLGASIGEVSWALAGSQDIQTFDVTIGGRQLTVEAETYVGLTISGDDDLVTAVAERVAQRLRNGA